MKTINIKNYNPSMGVLIDVRHPLDYVNQLHHPNSKNIYYDKLIYEHKKYMNKDTEYFIVCNKGKLSKKAVMQLNYLGYNVTFVQNNI